MNRKLIRKAILPLLVLLSLPTGSSAIAASVNASVKATALGKIVVDGKGMTAYFFDLDKANSGKSACSGGCAANWPAITSASANPHVAGISGKVGTIAGIAGNRQITINGRPIYTFAFDKTSGQTSGQGAQGLWYVISPSGQEIKALKIAPSAKPTTHGKYNY